MTSDFASGLGGVLKGAVWTGWTCFSVAFVGEIVSRIQRQHPFKKNWETGTVYLYQFPRSRCIPSISPNCLKLETWLRMADIPYENVSDVTYQCFFPRNLPFIELNGVPYRDSSFIITNLTQIFNKTLMDAHLLDEQLASSRAIEQMIANSTILTYSYIRNVEQPSKMYSRDVIGESYSRLISLFGPILYPRKVKNRLRQHGIGRHSRDDIVNIGLDDLRALSFYLGEKLFFNGIAPTRVDATAFGFLAQILYLPLDTEFKQTMQSEYPNLVAYCERMKEKYWPDWEEITETLSLDTSWKSE